MKKGILTVLVALAGTAFLQAKSVETLSAPKARNLASSTVVKGIHITTPEELNKKALNTEIQKDAEMTGEKVIHANKSLGYVSRMTEVQYLWVLDQMQTGHINV